MSIEIGSKLQGKVTGITNFGAFVELPGGSTGLVHISEVADNYVKDINEHLKVGDEVTVKVINEKDGKIGLSIKKAIDRPERSERPRSTERPRNTDRSRPRANDFRNKENFEQKMSRFLKDSEDRLSSLKRNTESKRGGRGARRG
ncbi:S1 domain-containing RNA-binding protein [Metabacillus fastidiosus]|uniref:S1 domain-containing RNA-binding protein n=1 Tax=Metabacillus fastidiosus TaxID=1458 RepID=A0ABU6P505_9BACI|nr:S1 domain-containing RNA-binding protein [Metabacillus fastidiosus]MEC2076606.1 S1 domain-containing RNA-binding protein [Metabacillus fastidiosus]MED4404155.1 S1 domain-containing RNA-binding protein [Metabacillus fastidiosus]MED4455564.1 S1 domain-containing RNA-binding protein [Metabacillus fastidiosus]MED4464706.1 S1 domain-containing RNA-binding protein [Metabacillus fastidiosus]MED4533436.1 S1 domain-containing RNA-binding protein [Metabacillus fastidiosus]